MIIVQVRGIVILNLVMLRMITKHFIIKMCFFIGRNTDGMLRRMRTKINCTSLVSRIVKISLNQADTSKANVFLRMRTHVGYFKVQFILV